MSVLLTNTGALLSKAKRKLMCSLEQRGPLGAVKWMLTRCYYHAWLHVSPAGRRELHFDFDLTMGVVTTSAMQIRDLHIESPSQAYATGTAAVQPGKCFALLSRLDIRYEEFIFIDLGAGTGRALIIAAQFPFRRIIGIEFSPDLVRMALNNIASARNIDRKCQDISVQCMDVVDYRIPTDNVVLYLYNPFQAELMKRVLTNIHRARRNNEAELYIIYINGVHALLFKPCCETVYRTIDSYIYRYRSPR